MYDTPIEETVTIYINIYKYIYIIYAQYIYIQKNAEIKQYPLCNWLIKIK